MTMYLGMLAAGLVVGVLVGFTAGKAYAPGYREWVTENESTFAKGYSGGLGRCSDAVCPEIPGLGFGGEEHLDHHKGRAGQARKGDDRG